MKIMSSPPYHSAEPWACPNSTRKSVLRNSSTRDDNFLRALPNEFAVPRGLAGMKTLIADTLPSDSPGLCRHLGTMFQHSPGRDKPLASVALVAAPPCSESKAACE